MKEWLAKLWKKTKDGWARLDYERDGDVDRDDLLAYQRDKPNSALLIAVAVGAALMLAVVLFIVVSR